MKKLLLLSALFIFACSNDDEPLDQSFQSVESEFKGLWSGDITGEDNGTWTLTVKDSGTLLGSFTSKDYNEIYSF